MKGGGGMMGTTYQKRYFTISKVGGRHILRWYDEKGSSACKGELSLEGATVTEGSGGNFDVKESVGWGGAKRKLRAASQAEAREWIDAIRKAT